MSEFNVSGKLQNATNVQMFVYYNLFVRDGVFICLDEKSSFCSTVHNIFQLETTFLLSNLDDQ